MNAAAARLFRVLDARVGRVESPKGSNSDRGGVIDRCQWRYGMGRGTRTGAVPWCNCHIGDALAEAGIDDHGIMSPATSVTEARARALGFVIRYPIPGAQVLWSGRHIGTVKVVYSATRVLTNEGNSNDACREVVRDLAGTVLIALPAIRSGAVEPPKPVTLYAFEDTRGRMLHPGLWRTKLFAQRARKRMGPLGRDADLTKRNGRWRIRMPRFYTGYAKEAGRDAWLAKRQAEIRRYQQPGSTPVRLRPYRYTVTVLTNPQAEAQGLGRTI